MKLPRRRGSRPFNGNPADHAPTEQWFSQLRTGPADGTTYEWHGGSVIPPGVKAVKQTGRDTHPFAFRGQPAYGPPAALPPPPPTRPALAITAAAATPAEAALTSLQLRVRALALKGQLDRVSDEKLHDLAARRRDRLRQPRTTAKVIIDEALELLRAGREPWNPDGAA
jgi:hypothetical protein